MARKRRTTRHVAFSVSAGCYPYQMGVASYIQKHFDLQDVFFSGASGGTWPAVLLAADEDMERARDILVEYGPECCEGRGLLAPLGAYGVYDQGVRKVFNMIFGEKQLPAVVNGRLAISLTRVAWDGFVPYLKDEVVSHFLSNDDIYEGIIASALIPFAINGKPFVKYRDWNICLDAGLTNVPGVLRSYQSNSSSSGGGLKHEPADRDSLYVEVWSEEKGEGTGFLSLGYQHMSIAGDHNHNHTHHHTGAGATHVQVEGLEDAAADDDGDSDSDDGILEDESDGGSNVDEDDSDSGNSSSDDDINGNEECKYDMDEDPASWPLVNKAVPKVPPKTKTTVAGWTREIAHTVLYHIPSLVRQYVPSVSDILSRSPTSSEGAVHDYSTKKESVTTTKSNKNINLTVTTSTMAAGVRFLPSPPGTMLCSRASSTYSMYTDDSLIAPTAPLPYGIYNLGILAVSALANHVAGKIANKVNYTSGKVTGLVTDVQKKITQVAAAPARIISVVHKETAKLGRIRSTAQLVDAIRTVAGAVVCHHGEKKSENVGGVACSTSVSTASPTTSVASSIAAAGEGGHAGSYFTVVVDKDKEEVEEEEEEEGGEKKEVLKLGAPPPTRSVMVVVRAREIKQPQIVSVPATPLSDPTNDSGDNITATPPASTPTLLVATPTPVVATPYHTLETLFVDTEGMSFNTPQRNQRLSTWAEEHEASLSSADHQPTAADLDNDHHVVGDDQDDVDVDGHIQNEGGDDGEKEEEVKEDDAEDTKLTSGFSLYDMFHSINDTMNTSLASVLGIGADSSYHYHVKDGESVSTDSSSSPSSPEDNNNGLFGYDIGGAAAISTDSIEDSEDCGDNISGGGSSDSPLYRQQPSSPAAGADSVTEDGSTLSDAFALDSTLAGPRGCYAYRNTATTATTANTAAATRQRQIAQHQLPPHIFDAPPPSTASSLSTTVEEAGEKDPTIADPASHSAEKTIATPIHDLYGPALPPPPTQRRAVSPTRSSSPYRNLHGRHRGNFWHGEPGHAVKKIPTGGRLLEIAPWTWRKQPLIHYHLTGDEPTIIMLFDLGYADAHMHHEELARFFKVRSTKTSNG